MTKEEAIKKLHWFALDNRDKQIIDMAIEALQDRPQGEWIAVSEYGRWMRKCTSCGWKQFIDSPKMMGWYYKYCPNCGAKMERREE